MIHPPTPPRAGHRLVAAAGALGLAATSLLALGVGPAMAAGPICGTFDRALVSGGSQVVQNNAWGNTAGQCVAPHDGGFTITKAEGDLAFGGAPKSYPSIFVGEHYGERSSTASLPVKVSEIGTARTSANIMKAPGAWNAAWDIWVNSSPDSPGENDDTEVMVWASQQGGPTPIGTKVDTIIVENRPYDVWKGAGPTGTDVLSYVDVETTTTPDVPLGPFLEDSIARGATSADSYLTSVQFGFEPWKGGAGLAVDNFTYSPTGQAQAPATPAPGDGQPAPKPGGDQGGAPAPAPTPAAATGAGVLVGAASGRCVDVAGRSVDKGAPLQLWDCQDANAAQQWTPRAGALVNAGSGLCLDLAQDSTAKGARAQQWTCTTDAPGQQWKTGRGGALVNPASGLCLDAKGAGTANSTPLILWDCNDADNQVWTTR